MAPSSAPAPAPASAPTSAPTSAPASAPASASAAPGQAPASSAQASALQALGGLTADSSQVNQPPTPAAQAPPQPSHVGNWTASLANGARVQLILLANGTFTWSATNKSGAASRFQGSYTIADGALTLIRSSDNQKLAGTMTRTSNDGFSFQLAGVKDAALNFIRG